MQMTIDVVVPAGAQLEEIPVERRQTLVSWAAGAIRVPITHDEEGVLLIGQEALGRLVENGIITSSFAGAVYHKE